MIRRTITPEFWFGNIVYQRVDTDHEPGMVTGVRLYYTGEHVYYVYEVTWNGDFTICYGYELTDTPQFTIPTDSNVNTKED